MANPVPVMMEVRETYAFGASGDGMKFGSDFAKVIITDTKSVCTTDSVEVLYMAIMS
jgi:hypothetical protein